MPIDRDLAANGNEGTFTPFQLLAGESDIITTVGNAAAATVWAKYQVLALVAGLLVPYDDTSSAGAQTAYAIAAQPKIATAAVSSEPIYVGGVFNHQALVWPAGADTFAERQAAFARTNVVIDKIIP